MSNSRKMDITVGLKDGCLSGYGYVTSFDLGPTGGWIAQKYEQAYPTYTIERNITYLHYERNPIISISVREW